MTTTSTILREVADLLTGLPGLPAPFVMVLPASSTVVVSWSTHDEPEMHTRIVAAEAALALVGGEAQPQANGAVGGEVRDWHGHTLRITAHPERQQAVA